MGHIIILSHCRDAALAPQSEPNPETCTESRITVYNNMFKQLSESKRLQYITSERSGSPRPTRIQKHCIRQYLQKQDVQECVK